MAEAADKWAAGPAYDMYMGRWSRPLARAFLGWLNPKPAGHWLEVGCGTGLLTVGYFCELGRPASVVACYSSKPFIDHAQSQLSDARASFAVAGADALPTRAGGFDAIVSGLVLNFIPEPERALGSMRERANPDRQSSRPTCGTTPVAVEFLQCFWEEAVALDSEAAALDESGRFGTWQVSALTTLFRAAGLFDIDAGTLEIATDLSDFDDFWKPFLGGTGPAPSYVAALDTARRELLKDRLRGRLGSLGDRIRLRARASVVRGSCTGSASHG